MLIHQCDGSPAHAASGHEDSQPPTALIRRRVGPADRGSRAVHEVFTEMAIPALSDSEEPWRTARRVFGRDQVESRCQLAAVLERGYVTDRGAQRGGTQWSITWDGL
jgi:hypothetical protein